MKKKGKSKSKLESLSIEQIEAVTRRAEARKNVPIVSSKQVNMRLAPEILNQAKRLAKAQGKPVTTFLSSLLKEDIERLWKVFAKASGPLTANNMDGTEPAN